tara:strand:+ start:357 stop:512 length:156 start_codon:yes stop_codon:yes gene_type:complete
LKPEQMIGYVIFLIIALIVAAITIPSIFAEIGPYTETNHSISLIQQYSREN